MAYDHQAMERGGHRESYAHGGAGLSAESHPVADHLVASPESSPFPVQAVMFRLCARCGRDMGSVAVPYGDPAEGRVSHGYCDSCAALSWAETEAFLRGLGLAPLPGGAA